jgi:uncharacterized protein YciI
MKTKLLFTVVALLLMTVFATGQTVNTQYDSTLARTLGADERGMKMYVLVILKTGSNNVQDKEKRDSLFRGHMESINRLAEQKKLVVAGPLEKNENEYRGIFILDVKTFEEAEELLSGDPTVRDKVFFAELYQWYGSAALPEYIKYSDRIRKYKR